MSASSTKPDNNDSAILSTNRQKKECIVRAYKGKHETKIADGFSSSKPLESVNSMLERLFESTQRARPDLPVKSRYSQTLNPRYVVVDDKQLNSLKNDLAIIQRMMDKGISTKRTLQAMIMLPSFKNRSSPDARSAADKALLLLNHTLQDLLSKVIRDRISLLGSENMAKPDELVQLYVACDVMQEEWWHMIPLHLLAEVTKSRTGSYKGGLPSLENSDARFPRSLYLLSDVIQVWKMFAKAFGTPSKLSQSSDRSSSGDAGVMRDHVALAQDWEGLPSPEAVRDINRGLRPGFSTQFLYCFPQKTESLDSTTLAVAAAMTYVSLRAAEQTSIVSESLAAESKPFMDIITQIIWYATSDEPAFLTRFSDSLEKRGIVPAVADQLYDEWRSLRQEARDRQGQNSGKEANGIGLNHTRRTAKILAASQERSSSNNDHEQFMITQELSAKLAPESPKVPLTNNLLRQAAKELDVKLALKLWKRQVKRMSQGKEINDLVFVDFLRTFFAVARPDCATEVWNTMCKHGYKPTTMHWVTLLEGCKKTQDLASLKSIWRHMVAAEMQNTNQAWTVYISGLLYCKDWSSALTAIGDLGKAWKLSNGLAASKSTEASSTAKQQIVHKADQFTPSIFPINAAISGLLGNRKVIEAQQILTWAISKNIKPDTTTFNILLRPAVRHDDTKAMQRLLGEMKQQGCNPDVVTFTIVIDGMFRNPGSALQIESPEAQQALIVRVFKDMHENNIEATAQTYSTILDGLLHPRSFNLPAARAVLARMTDQGIRPTPHIYTILVTHYFSLVPPDLPAIESLWRRIELEKSPIDHIFYDRMIEGYGRVGAIDKMLAVLRRMPSEGKRPGWIALLGALKALVQAQEWSLVTDLVGGVVEEKEGLLRYGSRGWRGKEEFWEFVEVMRDRGLEMPCRREFVEGGEVAKEDGGEEKTVDSEV